MEKNTKGIISSFIDLFGSFAGDVLSKVDKDTCPTPDLPPSSYEVPKNQSKERDEPTIEIHPPKK